MHPGGVGTSGLAPLGAHPLSTFVAVEIRVAILPLLVSKVAAREAPFNIWRAFFRYTHQFIG